MNNEPVAWIDKTDIEDGFFYPTILTKMETISNNIPLYTHPGEHDLGIAEAIGFEKGHKSAEDMLRQQQAEIEALKAKDLKKSMAIRSLNTQLKKALQYETFNR